jgi:hypothetical protein
MPMEMIGVDQVDSHEYTFLLMCGPRRPLMLHHIEKRLCFTGLISYNVRHATYERPAFFLAGPRRVLSPNYTPNQC